MTWRNVNDLVVLRPVGDLREGPVGDDVERALCTLAAQGRNVLLDLGETRQLSARAIGILAGACREALGHGGRVAVCGLHQRHRWLFGVTHLACVMDVYDSESAAIAGLTAPAADGWTTRFPKETAA